MVVHPTDALPNPRSLSSPLKTVTSAQASSNGTPVVSTAAPNVVAAAQATSLDLAEQLNEEEKRKYVKGMFEDLLDDLE